MSNKDKPSYGQKAEKRKADQEAVRDRIKEIAGAKCPFTEEEFDEANRWSRKIYDFTKAQGSTEGEAELSQALAYVSALSTLTLEKYRWVSVKLQESIQRIASEQTRVTPITAEAFEKTRQTKIQPDTEK
jgi:hypothetical protein